MYRKPSLQKLVSEGRNSQAIESLALERKIVQRAAFYVCSQLQAQERLETNKIGRGGAAF